MSDVREALVALLNHPDHAPMSTHDPRDGSCQSCPWPLHEMPPEDIADAILASFDVTPRGERVKPSVEALADALAAEGIDAEPGDLDLIPTAERLLALLPGRTEAEVKAEALREAAPGCNCEDDYAWLNDRADRIEKEADRG